MKMKNNSAIIILTSAVCLLPIILSLVVYNKLPEQIAIHWNSAGEPDNFAPKAVAAFGLPFLFAALNLYSKMRLFNDPKHSGRSHVMVVFAAWIPPVLSLLLVPITLFIAMGINIPLSLIAPILVGCLLIICGNYLPKCRHNYTIGIKLPWTLHDIDNWNKTHRVAGYLWMLGGAVMIAVSFVSGGSHRIQGIPLVIFIIFFLVIIPTLYSYSLYRKNRNDE